MGDEIDVMFEQWLKGYAQGKELPNEEYNKLRNCFRECAEMMSGKIEELEKWYILDINKMIIGKVL